jgi:hypothetical protein
MAVSLAAFKGVLTANWMLKLVALLLALLSVLGVRRMTNHEEDFTVPIVVKVEAGAAILNQDARMASITCRGADDDLRRVDERQIKAIVRPALGGYAGSERVPIGPKNVEGWLRGVKVVRVRPDVVTVTLDREITSEVAVARPELIGTPVVGRAEVDYEPKTVVLRGPRGRIVDKKIVRVEPINVAGAVESFTAEVKVLTEGDEGLYKIEPATLTARIAIVTESVSREWTNVAVRALVDLGSRQSIEIAPPTVSVTLHGSAETVKNLPDRALRVFVDCENLTTGRVNRLPVVVSLPPGMEVSAVTDPQTVKVTVEERKTDATPP